MRLVTSYNATFVSHSAYYNACYHKVINVFVGRWGYAAHLRVSQCWRRAVPCHAVTIHLRCTDWRCNVLDGVQGMHKVAVHRTLMSSHSAQHCWFLSRLEFLAHYKCAYYYHDNRASLLQNGIQTTQVLRTYESKLRTGMDDAYGRRCSCPRPLFGMWIYADNCIHAQMELSPICAHARIIRSVCAFEGVRTNEREIHFLVPSMLAV